jgi:hypothetical protein
MKTSFIAVLHIGSPSDYITVYIVGGRVLTSLQNNATVFINPDPSLATLSGALELLDTLIKSKNGSDEIDQKIDDQSLKVYNLLKDLAFYVNKIAKGDKTIIILSGFECKEESIPHEIPGKVQIDRIENGSTEHSAKIFVKSVADADRYNVEMTYTSNDPDSFKIALVAVSRHNMEIQNLLRGKEVFLRISAGNTHGFGPHSDIVGFIPQ